MTAPVRVLQSFPVPRPTTNPYIVMLAESLQGTAGVTLLPFDPRTALWGRYDLYHAHWPETFLGGRTRLRTVVRHGVFTLFLLRLTITGVPVVRTVHNLELPSGISAPTRLLLRWVEALTVLRITLNATTELPPSTAVRQILHGHYRTWYRIPTPPPTVAGRLLFFGLIRRYKGIDGLLDAFASVPSDSGLSLRIAGKPSAGLADPITATAATDPRVSALLEFLDDPTLTSEVLSSELVVLPYRDMHNSGAALTALSLGRPVLVPANRANEALAAEVGEGWVLQYEGGLTAEHLQQAVAEVRSGTRSSEPDLGARNWDRAGEDHREAYRAAVDLRPGILWWRRLRRRRTVSPTV